MNPSEVFFFCLVLLMLAWQAKCNDKYDIPVAINPLIQDPDAIDAEASFFYNSDKIFFSKVTVIDATINAEQPIQETIQKKISVVFLTVASSHVSGTLKLDDLRYKTKSKWSYSVDVRSILKAGTLTKIDDQTIIYKIQENAMKVLEERFDFEKSEILNRLEMQSMEYYAVDEAKWIKVVEIIVEKVIANRSESLKLTSCYLAEMVGKTVAQMQGFTLNEVDMHIYNKTVLLEKLPEYRNNVLTQLYQTFEMTSTDLAKISGTNLSEINTMTLNDVLKLFTNSVLSKLRVTALDVAEKDSSFDPEMLLSCTDKWEPFKSIVVPESFDNSAQAMAVEVKVLSNLIETNYTEIRQLAILEMINLLEMTIDPLSADKKLIETTILSDVLSRDGSDKINSNEDDIFEVIYKFTNFTERQLTILYGWTSKDYQFSALFTLEDTNSVCNIKYLSYDLLALAKLTVGQMGDISCKSFNVLKEIWERRSVAFLEDKYSSEQQLQLDIPISETVRHLTKAPSTINYRVLNVTSETKELISKLSINNITAVTTYQSEDLKALPFQDVIGIIVHLKRNGSFDHQLVSHFILTLTPSLMTTSITNFYITNNNRPTSTNQILRKTSAEHRTSTFSHMDTIVLTSSLLRFLSTSQMPKNTFMTLPNQANTTMSRHRTGNGTATHPVPSTTKHLSAEYTSLSQSKIRSTLGVNSTTSSYNSVAIKNTLNNTKMLNYTKSTIRNISFPDSTLQPLTSFLPSRYNSNSQSNILYINPTTSKEHFVEYTSISNASAMISSSNDSNISKTIVTISSNETKRIMTEESPSFSTGIGSNVPVGHTTIRLTPSTVIDTTSTAVLTKNVAGVSTNTFTPGQYSSNNTQHSKVSQTKYSIPTSTHRASQIKIINSTSSQSQRSHLTDSSIITHNTRTSDMKLGTEEILTKTKSRIISVKQNHSTTDMSTVLVTPHNTMMETTSTKVMVNTTKSSAVAGTDPSSYKQHTTSNGNKSLPTMISLVIQTTHIESIKHTSAQATTPHVTPSITATTVVIPKKMTSFPTTLTKLDTSSMFEASTTMNVFQSTAKTSTTTNHPKSRMTAVLIPSSNPYTTNAQVETSTPHISNYVLSTSPIISEPTILPTSMTSLIKPSTTKVAIALSSSQQTGKVRNFEKEM